MLRVIVVLGAMVALLALAGAGAGAILFTYTAFDLLGFHPIALDFLEGRLNATQMGEQVLLGARFSQAEIDHLMDVGAVMDRTRLIAAVGGAVVISISARAPALMGRAAGFALGLFASIAGLVGAAYAIFGFDRVGVVFHTVFFPAGNWRFGWDALIIRLYGANEMVAGAGFVIGTTLVIVVAVLVVCRWLGARQAGEQS